MVTVYIVFCVYMSGCVNSFDVIRDSVEDDLVCFCVYFEVCQDVGVWACVSLSETVRVPHWTLPIVDT